MVRKQSHELDLNSKSPLINLSSYKTLVENSFEGVCVLDDQYWIIYVNPSLCRLLQIPENKILGKKLSDFLVDPLRIDQMNKLLRPSLKGQIQFEEQFATGNDDSVWLSVLVDTLAGDNVGQTVSLVHFMDVTDLKKREIHAKMLGEFHSKLIELTDIEKIFLLIGKTIHEIIPGRIVGIAVVDEKQEQVSVLKLLGVGSVYEELITKFNLDLPKIKFQLKESTQYEYDLFTSEKLRTYENDLYSLLLKRIPKKICSLAEKRLQINHIAIMGFLSEGRHLGGMIICSKDDISQYSAMIESVVFQGMQVVKRIHSEMSKALSEERLHQTFDAIEDGYWDWNISSGEVIVNDRWFTMLGYQPNEFPSTLDNFMKLIHPDDVETTQTNINQALANPSQNYNIDFRLRTKSGDYKCILSRGKVVGYTGSKNPVRMVGTHTDITDQKRLERDKRLFYETQKKLMQVSTLPELYDLIGNCLIKLAEGYAVFTRYEEKIKSIKITGFYGFGRNLDDLAKHSKFLTRNSM